jgi:microcystin-dependent protein
MSDAFVGEIRMFGGNFPPVGWAFCDGQLVSRSVYSNLFNVIGTTYGAGDGATTFALPDLRSRNPMHRGHGPGLHDRPLAAKSGAENVGLDQAMLPAHTHDARANAASAAATSPANAVPAARAANAYAAASDGGTRFDQHFVYPTGGGLRHPNMAPYLPVSFIIALDGVIPVPP